MAKLITRGDTPCVVPQVLYECWVVATRPIRNGGLGWSPTAAGGLLADVELVYPLFPDTSELYRRWRDLVITHGVSGKPAHDARLVAAMACHAIPTLLTFNTADFTRYVHVQLLSPLTMP